MENAGTPIPVSADGPGDATEARLAEVAVALRRSEAVLRQMNRLLERASANVFHEAIRLPGP